MEEQISLLIRILPSGKEVEIELPLTTLGAEIKKALLEHPELQIPKIDSDGSHIPYRLSSKSKGKEVKDESTLKELNIVDGDTLLMAPVIIAGGGGVFINLKTAEFLNWLSQNGFEENNLSEKIIDSYLQAKGKPTSISFILRIMPRCNEIEIEAPLSAKIIDLYNALIQNGDISEFDAEGNSLDYNLAGTKAIDFKSSVTIFEAGLDDRGCYLVVPFIKANRLMSSFKSMRTVEYLFWLENNGLPIRDLSKNSINSYLLSKGKSNSISFVLQVMPQKTEIEIELSYSSHVYEIHNHLIKQGLVFNKSNDGIECTYEIVDRDESSIDSRCPNTIFEIGFEAGGIYLFVPKLQSDFDIEISLLHLNEFHDWLREKYMGINAFSSIPSEKLNQLIQRFCEDKGYEDVSFDAFFNPFKRKLYSPFSYQKKIDKFKMAFNAIFNRKKYKQEIITHLFKRYQEIKFHGFFLFAQGDGTYRNIYKKYWEDINHLTSNYMDLYFSKEDLEGKSGFETLNRMDSIQHLADEIILPSLILWNVERGLKNAIAIPLKGFNSDYILFILQLLVTAIKKKMDLREIGLFVQQKIETSFIAPTNLSVTYIEKQEAENIFNIENLKNT
ncbi:EsaB/YukD family protein [Haliscomenobacter sp.]|uniref:EsaB/YukD family protein n=1 Tax=Haliscomenobacter sp. TaxID=2717303 RepID=UPI003BABB5D8